MSIVNTPSLAQRPRSYAVQLSSANTNYTSPTNTALLWVAGPEGSDIEGLSAVANANQSSANQVQFFASPDGGTTFNVLSLSAALTSGNIGQTAALQSANFNLPSGVPMGPSSPLRLGGVPGAVTHMMSKSLLTESSIYFRGAIPTGGSANAQTCALVYDSSGSQLPASPTVGTIADLIGGLTCTGSMTLQLGLQASGATVKRAGGSLANTSSGDVTALFPYRFIWDGPNWQLLITQRLYAAIGEAQGVTVTAYGRDY